MSVSKSIAEWRKSSKRTPIKRGAPEKRPIESCYLHLGHVCLEMRERRNFSQQYVATGMGWTRASVANLEGGKQRVMLHDFPKLAKVLGVRIADLFAPGWVTA